MSNIIAYKLFRKRKDGTLGSLFINRKKVLPLNEWVVAEEHPTKGYYFRPYWHCCAKPEAPHLSTKNRVWAEVEIQDYLMFCRPQKQGGVWYLSKQIKIKGELQ